MSTPTSYHRIIRKTIIAFADLFNHIVLIRENKDGSENERFVVPIAYATKEKYFDRIEGDPEANKKIQMTLPRLSYEMTGFSYDPTRKLNTNVKNFALDQDHALLSQYNPVPYNFNFSLYMYTRTIEDSTQILEHILPYFTPDYTIKINMIPEMNIVKELPIILDNSSYDIGYEGDFNSEIRHVIWTLTFTVKGYLFGGIQQPKIIKETIQNTYIDYNMSNHNVKYYLSAGGYGKYKTEELVYQGLSLSNSTATGIVEHWESHEHILEIKDISGKFVLGHPIKGNESLASWELAKINNDVTNISTITTTPSPNTANADSNYTYNEIITRYE